MNCFGAVTRRSSSFCLSIPLFCQLILFIFRCFHKFKNNYSLGREQLGRTSNKTTIRADIIHGLVLLRKGFHFWESTVLYVVWPLLVKRWNFATRFRFKFLVDVFHWVDFCDLIFLRYCMVIILGWHLQYTLIVK